MTVSISGTNGLVFNDASVQNTSAFTGGFAFRNRIINGAMVIDQRNAGASVTPSTSAAGFAVDRFPVAVSQNSKLTVQQNAGSVTPPTGFANYVGVTSSSAYSITSTDYFVLEHKVEGYNMADFGWGAANVSSVILSFWVRSSLTGTFGLSLRNAGNNRALPLTYTISSANTWEYKTILITGDTSGTWNTTNGVGVSIEFGLGVGSTYSGTAGAWAGANYLGATGATSVVGTNGATFYITGVQLEKGSTATSFDYRPYGTELRLCQRYYSVATTTTRFGSYSGIQYLRTTISTPASMRASPTVTKLTNGTLSNTVAGNITYTSLSPTQFGFEVASSATGDCYAIGGTASLESEL